MRRNATLPVDLATPEHLLRVRRSRYNPTSITRLILGAAWVLGDLDALRRQIS